MYSVHDSLALRDADSRFLVSRYSPGAVRPSQSITYLARQHIQLFLWWYAVAECPPHLVPHTFGLDLVYMHMNLNGKVCPVSSVPFTVLNPKNRSTLRACSSHGTDIIFNTLICAGSKVRLQECDVLLRLDDG